MQGHVILAAAAMPDQTSALAAAFEIVPSRQLIGARMPGARQAFERLDADEFRRQKPVELPLFLFAQARDIGARINDVHRVTSRLRFGASLEDLLRQTQHPSEFPDS